MTISENSRVSKELTICDDCSLIPYDMRIGVVNEWDYEDTDDALDQFDIDEANGLLEQIGFMVEMGGVVADHACTLREDPEAEAYGVQCDCGCNNKRRVR